MTLSSRKLLPLLLGATIVATSACDDDPAGPDPLVAPQNLVATAQSPTSVELNWNQVSDADFYQVERGTGGTFTTVAANVTATSYDDDGLTANTQYQYRVRAARTGNDFGPYSTIATVTTPQAGPKVANLTGNITADRTLYADTVYTLVGLVKVASGATLTIQPGTRIIGDFDQPGSSLWILRGANIDAQGTAAAPIVFTSERDPAQARPGDWGGIIIIGNGIINRSGAVLTEGPASFSENYGQGTDNTDDSGNLRYVRVEYAGYDVSGTGQELNSISSYAVGGGTQYEYVQTVGGLDDAFEWWGGAVDGRYLISTETGDDHFDASEGYRGRVQYAIALQTPPRLQPTAGRGGLGSDPRGMEIDGCDPSVAGCDLGFASTPFTIPVFANFTLVGPGTGGFGTITDGNGMVIRRGAGGAYVNGIVARWPGYGLSVRDDESEALRVADSLIVRNIIFAENDRGAYEPLNPTSERYAANFDVAANENRTVADAEPLFVSLPAPATAVTAANFDLTPAAGSAAATGGVTTFPATIAALTANFFGAAMTATDFVGAVDPDGPKWWQGWTTFVAR